MSGVVNRQFFYFPPLKLHICIKIASYCIKIPNKKYYCIKIKKYLKNMQNQLQKYAKVVMIVNRIIRR